jgi:hypothetical protein
MTRGAGHTRRGVPHRASKAGATIAPGVGGVPAVASSDYGNG